jgi:chloramphenicol O-acetyltransferase type A
VTSRVDVTGVLARRAADGLSPCRACPFAIGSGLHAVPELCVRFRGETVLRHDRLDLSMTVPLADGTFRCAYVPCPPDFAAFDESAARTIAEVSAGGDRNANAGARDDVAYLSCMPWFDYTSLNNALPHAQDCIPACPGAASSRARSAARPAR